MKIVLDACALIAFLRGETGADVVESILLDENNFCLVHAINLCEVYYDFLRAEGEETALAAISDLTSIGLFPREDMNQSFWQGAGRYKANFHLSLADCFALALTKQENGVLVTSDHREFDPIARNNICTIKFIR